MTLVARTADPATVTLAEFLTAIEDAQTSGEQLLVFCTRTDTATSLVDSVHLLTDAKAVALTGALTTREREVVLSYLHMDDAPTVIVATDAYATGWSAPSRCTRVLHAELPGLPTRPMLIAQREARIRRLHTVPTT